MKINLNMILRQDAPDTLVFGKEYSFSKQGLSLLADELAIWLTDKEWTALAEIMVTSQMRKDGTTTGTYKVLHTYEGEEQKTLTETFCRMYGWQ